MRQALPDNLGSYRRHYYNHVGFVDCSCLRKIYLATFNSYEAFMLGTLVRQMAVQYFQDKCAIIHIALADGQCLFHCVVNDATTPFNQSSVDRKTKIAMKFGCSSMQVQHLYYPFEQEKIPPGDAKKESIQRHTIAYYKGDHDAMAGAIPIYLTTLVGPPVAFITIDGLEPYENHWLAFECLVALVEDQAGTN